jgi:hypothetical protein
MKGYPGFKISGKINGTKIDVKAPIVPPKISPEAVIRGYWKPVNVFHLGDTASTDNTLNLYSMSTPYSAKFSYAWRQTGGEDLKLAAADLVKDRLAFPIYKAGKYTFQLAVSDGDTTSAPAEVEVEAVEARVKQ